MKKTTKPKKGGKYMIDNDYVDKMARICGWKGTIVYISLCRHANKERSCYPSIDLMAEQHGVSRPTIIKGVKILEEKGLITKTQKFRGKNGRWKRNTYILADKFAWEYDRDNDIDLDTDNQVNESKEPDKSDLLNQVNKIDTKETNNKGNKYKKTNNKKKKTFYYTERDMELAELLVDLIKYNNPDWKMKGDWKEWAWYINRLHNEEERSYADIEKMIRWSQQDKYWFRIVISTKKLYKLYNNLIPKYVGWKRDDGVIKDYYAEA